MLGTTWGKRRHHPICKQTATFSSDWTVPSLPPRPVSSTQQARTHTEFTHRMTHHHHRAQPAEHTHCYACFHPVFLHTHQAPTMHTGSATKWCAGSSCGGANNRPSEMVCRQQLRWANRPRETALREPGKTQDTKTRQRGYTGQEARAAGSHLQRKQGTKCCQGRGLANKETNSNILVVSSTGMLYHTATGCVGQRGLEQCVCVNQPTNPQPQQTYSPAGVCDNMQPAPVPSEPTANTATQQGHATGTSCAQRQPIQLQLCNAQQRLTAAGHWPQRPQKATRT
jgi:hypothetical protein